jgi:DNA polymerase-3 subunit delta'
MNARAETAPPAPPWTEAARAALTTAHAQDHLPHALLIHEAPGSGGEWLALWCAQLVLCAQRGAAPCGSCQGCRRVGARQHPDLIWIGPEENSRQLRIEQVRDLGAELALTSHAGGYKVGILTPADLLNRFAANALLKTLEEPAARTLLILVVTQPSRLPPTVLSRCQRVRVPAPSRAQSLAWLTAARGPAQWDAALDALGEAPLIAVRSDPQEIAAVSAEARRTLDELTARGADPVVAAERWARSELPLRLQCFEIWLTERIRHRERAGDFMTEMRAGPHLSQGTPVLNIRELFQLVDEVRELRATLDVPLNRGVALESLFRRLAPSPGETHTRL